MVISKAKSDDLEEIFILVNKAIKYLEYQRIYQWNDYYPHQDLFYSDVTNETLYKWEEDQIKGIIAFDETQEEEYKDVDWNFNPSRIMVIHRLIVHPSFQGQGLGRKLMDFAENFAHENGYGAIRLDAYSGNHRAINFYQKRGYKIAGNVIFPKRELPFHCFEKRL